MAELYDVINADSPLFWCGLVDTPASAAVTLLADSMTYLGGAANSYSLSAGARGPACRASSTDNEAAGFDGSADEATWVDNGATRMAPITQTSGTKDPMTFEIYFRVDDWPADSTNQALWTLRSSATTQRHFYMLIRRSSGVTSLQYRVWDNASSVGVEWCRRLWNQVVLTYDPSLSSPYSRLYVNGSLAASPGGQSIWGGSEYRLSLGRDCLYDFDGSSPELFFDGQLAHFALYDTALSASDVAARWAAVCHGCAQPEVQILGPERPMARPRSET